MADAAREPVVGAALIAAAVGACLAVGASYGLPLTVPQQTAVQALVMAALPIAAALWARRKVTPVKDPKDNHGRRLVPSRPRRRETTDVLPPHPPKTDAGAGELRLVAIIAAGIVLGLALWYVLTILAG